MLGQDDLPLATKEYYALAELFIFHIELTQRGYAHAEMKLKSIPLPRKARKKFVERLNLIRTMVISEVQFDSK